MRNVFARIVWYTYYYVTFAEIFAKQAAQIMSHGATQRNKSVRQPQHTVQVAFLPLHVCHYVHHIYVSILKNWGPAQHSPPLEAATVLVLVYSNCIATAFRNTLHRMLHVNDSCNLTCNGLASRSTENFNLLTGLDFSILFLFSGFSFSGRKIQNSNQGEFNH